MVSVRVSLLVALVILITVVTSASARAETPRLRLIDPQLQSLITAGRARSPSFRALLDRLETTDVVVYLQCSRLRTRIDGELTFLTKAAGLRYVLVRIGFDLIQPRRIAVLGHELQHALEIAENPEIVSAETLAATYERLGFMRSRGLERVDFDTVEAIDAGLTVWRELAKYDDGD